MDRENQKFMVYSLAIIPTIILAVAATIILMRPKLDADGDGYKAGAGDCDDFNKLVNRGMVEDCANGIDDDCNRAADRIDRACRDENDQPRGEK